MDMQRALLAIVISFVILFGYQYLFVGFNPPPEETTQQPVETAQKQQAPAPSPNVQQTAPAPAAGQPLQPAPQTVQPVPPPSKLVKDVLVETDRYSAIISGYGGAIKSFMLKDHKEQLIADPVGKQLIQTAPNQGFPLKFSWGGLGGDNLVYDSSSQNVDFGGKTKATLKLSAQSGTGLEIERLYQFDKENYLFQLSVLVRNVSDNPLQGTPTLHQVNSPFQKDDGAASRFLFSGPAVYVNETLEEVKAKEFETGSKTIQGPVQWAAYEGNYFMCGVVPGEGLGRSVTMEGNEELVRMRIAGQLETLQSGEEKLYTYTIYYGPKKVSSLKEIGHNLDKAINFGWFDIIARPTLMLLNFFHSYVKNYGIAIILVTIIFKIIFWPITQKGLKSMKNMQKLQPKMASIKEKYKDDPTKMNQEVMNLYKTYKVNPLGGCLPMVLQIPVFFALYKVLLQCIELRHAPFMLWITDLSAPDRLWMDLGIPYLGGIPVLTLLMGASMFIQQKLTPTTADPTQAKIMMFLPVIFTFMFLNFASGLVLYWFVNNLLAILQQQLINRSAKKSA